MHLIIYACISAVQVTTPTYCNVLAHATGRKGMKISLDIKYLLKKEPLGAVEIRNPQWVTLCFQVQTLTVIGDAQKSKINLCQDVLEDIDPALELLLASSYIRHDEAMLLRLGNRDVKVSVNFRLLLTSKLGSPFVQSCAQGQGGRP